MSLIGHKKKKQLTVKGFNAIRKETWCRLSERVASHIDADALITVPSSIPPFSDDFPIPLNRANGFFVSQGLEATLSDSKKKFNDKVNVLLAAWEHVTNYIPGAPPETIQSLIEWAHRWVHVDRCCRIRDYVADPRLTGELASRRHGRRDICCITASVPCRITLLKKGTTCNLYTEKKSG